MAFGVLPTTHRYLIEYMSGVFHPKTMLSGRYSKFVDSLCMCSKMEVALLANITVQDNRTVMGKTIKAEARAELSVSDIKLGRKEPQIFSVPQDEEWRLP